MIEMKGKGGIEAKIIADSIHNGKRITTVQLRYHRFIHGEVMTHRMFSRNASSSRAIPVNKIIKQVRDDPATPIHWGKNQPGMQAGGELKGLKLKWVMEDWKNAANIAADNADRMSAMGGHKQIVNRILEPFQFMETVVTATEWDNFFALRIHKDAQPEIQELARCMSSVMAQSHPYVMGKNEWHTPYVEKSEEKALKMAHGHAKGLEIAIKCSAARCARVSYLNHDKSEPSVENDMTLYDMLATRPYDDGRGHVLGAGDPVHLSPLEHQATPIPDETGEIGEDLIEGITHIDNCAEAWSGNFKGWIQYRQYL